jgi:hypothetical protein
MISPWLMVIEFIFNGRIYIYIHTYIYIYIHTYIYIYKGYVMKYMANNMYLDELY